MDRYLLVHLAEHMYDSGRYEDLHELIGHDWMAAKRSELGSHRSLAQDLELALHAGQPAHATELPRLLKYCLLSLTLDVLTTNVPPEILRVLAAAGKVSQALANSELITEPFRRARAYQSIAEALLDRRQLEDAEPLWKWVRGLLIELGYAGERAPIMAAHARQMARAGRPADARQAVGEARGLIDGLTKAATPTSDLWRLAASSLADVAAAQALLGDGKTAAQSLAKAFTFLKRGLTGADIYDWMEGLRKIAGTMAANRDSVGLLLVVESDLLESASTATHKRDAGVGREFRLYQSRPLALAVMAQAIAHSGGHVFAERILERVRRDVAIGYLGQDRHAASAMAETALARATIFSEIGRQQTGSEGEGRGETDERPGSKRLAPEHQLRLKALQAPDTNLLEHLRDSRKKRVTVAVAEADQALARMADQERLHSRKAAGSRLQAGAAGAVGLASKVRLPGALPVAEHLKDGLADEHRSEHIRRMDNLLAQVIALAKTAAALALIGDRAGAQARFDQAIAALNKLESPLRRDQALRQIALAILHGGAWAPASTLAQASERLPRDLSKEDLYADLAVALARAGDSERASRAVTDAMLAAQDLDMENVASLAPRLAKAGHRNGLRLIVDEAEVNADPEDKGTVFAILAFSLARVGEGKLARELVRHAQGMLLSVDGLVTIPLSGGWIADAWAELGQQRQSRRMIRRALALSDTLAGRGMAGRLIYKVLDAFEDAQGQTDADEGMPGLLVPLLARPIVRANDIKSLARLLCGIKEIANQEDQIEALRWLATYFAPEGLWMAVLSGLGEEREIAGFLPPEPGRLSPTAAQRQMAQQALRDAASDAESLSVGARAKALSTLGLAQAMLEDQEGVSRTLSAIGDLPPGQHRVEALIEIAPALAWMGDRKGVDKACLGLRRATSRQSPETSPSSILVALRILAAAAETGDEAQVMDLVEQAVELTGQGVSSTTEIEVLAEMAGDLLEAQQWEPTRRLLDGSVRLAKTLESSEPGALAIVARPYALAGDERTACDLLTRGAMAARTPAAGITGAQVERNTMLDYLRLAIPALEALDSSGGVVASFWEQIREIDQWWDLQPRAGSP